MQTYQHYQDKESIVQRTMMGVYGYMTLALFISAGVGLYLMTNMNLLLRLVSGGTFWIIAIAEVAIVFVLSLRSQKLSPTAARLWFFAFAVINGVTFASVFASYGLGVAGYAFLITAITFGGMTLYGYITKTDLSRIGNIFVMALFGLILASFVGIFIKTPGYNLALTYISVIIFIGLTAYDTQKIKQLAYAEYDGLIKNASIIGALTLYLDFINIFLDIVRLLGRDD